jgi:phage terminase large subunit-like protein
MITANRISKSTWLVGDFSLYAMGRHPTWKTPKNAMLWIVVLTNEMAGVLLRKFKEMLRGPEKINWEYNDNKKSLFVKCGNNNWSTIAIKSQEAEGGSFEAETVHRLGFDEQPYEETFNQASLRTLDTGGQILIAGTMWEEGVSWMYDDFIAPVLEGRPEAKDIELVGPGLTMYDNLVLDRWEIDEYYRKLSVKNPEEARVRVQGEYIPLSGKCPFSMRSLNQYRNNAQPGLECELVYN